MLTLSRRTQLNTSEQKINLIMNLIKAKIPIQLIYSVNNTTIEYKVTEKCNELQNTHTGEFTFLARCAAREGTRLPCISSAARTTSAFSFDDKV